MNFSGGASVGGCEQHSQMKSASNKSALRPPTVWGRLLKDSDYGAHISLHTTMLKSMYGHTTPKV